MGEVTMELSILQGLALLGLPVAAAVCARLLVAIASSVASKKARLGSVQIDVTVTSPAVGRKVLHRELAYPVNEETMQGLLLEVRQQLA